MKPSISIACLLLVGLLIPSQALAQDLRARYPYRLPDWLWDTPRYAHLMTPTELLALRAEAADLAALAKSPSTRAADALELNLAARLSSKFDAQDLMVGAYMASHPADGTSLAIHLDPAFTPAAQSTLKAAAVRFLEVALDPQVIRKAFERSSASPPPMPAIHEVKDGKVALDEIGRPAYTEGYAFYLKQRAKPSSPQAFARHLQDVLRPPGGDPALLLISSYCCNVWWGGSYYGHHTEPAQQLKRSAPARGYLYIRLNTAKLASPEPGWNDPVLWASKIAHEVLHNLGYWHPNYNDPAERDANNQGATWAFIVSYETAILEKLRSSTNR
jgi:hypothetical protein